MSIASQIEALVLQSLKSLYGTDFNEKELTINVTKPEFEGDYTVVLFSLIKKIKRSPEQAGKEIGEHLIKHNPELFESYNVIKGFLNLVISDNFWIHFLQNNFDNKKLGTKSDHERKVMIEYSSPNTNKPLHLGHLRNIFLGWSLAEILKANGNDVIKSCIVNDRGIHICKSMIAWQMFANGANPKSTNTKGDHFVGDYYVKFNDEFKKQTEELIKKGLSKEEAEKEAPIMKATQQMLLDWEAGKPDVMELWEKMNSWVYEGFDITYKRIGADFDKIYYESGTYILGKKFVDDGLRHGVFFKKEDGSVWIDLTNDGLDEKLVRRKDGTSVYMTQDLGLADEKYEDFHYDDSIYVIGDEQNYHMKVLKLILQKLGKPYADGIFHLSYGMVELPGGKMKSREGTVVDADVLLDEMVMQAETKTKEQGKTEGFTNDELKELYEVIGLGGIKFFLLRVDPKKRMVFNPEESIDLHGFTATFIQYTHARIRSILRKESIGYSQSANKNNKNPDSLFTIHHSLLKLEKELIIKLEQYPTMIGQAAAEHNPSVLAIYAFEIAKSFNTFYTEHSVMNAESEEKKQLRLQLCEMTANVIASSMHLLGIKVPERM